jgi:hypothetical protein
VDVVCPVLAGGPPGEKADKPVKRTTGSQTFLRISDLPTGHIFLQGLTHLAKVHKIILSCLEALINRQPVKIDQKLIEEYLESANKVAIKFIVKTERKEEAAIGLLLAGIGMDLRRMIEGIEILQRIKNPDRKLLVDVKKIVQGGFDAFEKTDLTKAREVTQDYMKIRRYFKLKKDMSADEKNFIIGIEKLASNGFYIARLLPKPMPE